MPSSSKLAPDRLRNAAPGEAVEVWVYSAFEKDKWTVRHPADFTRKQVEVVDDYVGPGYGIPTPGMIEAVDLCARLEGLLIDPVYTGKAMSGLIGLVRSGRFKPTDTVVFVHTGGVPALFAYEDILTAG